MGINIDKLFSTKLGPEDRDLAYQLFESWDDMDLLDVAYAFVALKGIAEGKCSVLDEYRK